MSSGRRWLALFVATAVLASAAMAACNDNESITLPEAQSSGKTPIANTARIYSADELRAANPYGWVGRLHNYVVREIRSELLKANQTRTEACTRVADRLSQAELGTRGPQLTPELREQVKRALLRGTPCREPGTRTVAGPLILSDTTWVNPSSTAVAMMNDVVAEVDVATSANDLASRLSPYYNASLAMTFPDADAVQAIISIAQHSWDEWSPYVAYPSIEAAEIDYINGCAQGELQGVYYETSEGTFLCQSSEWLAVSFPRIPRRQNVLRLAGYIPVAQSVMCTSTSGDRATFIVGPDAFAGLGALTSGLTFGWVLNHPVAKLLQVGVAAGLSSWLTSRTIAKAMAEC